MTLKHSLFFIVCALSLAPSDLPSPRKKTRGKPALALSAAAGGAGKGTIEASRDTYDTAVELLSIFCSDIKRIRGMLASVGIELGAQEDPLASHGFLVGWMLGNECTDEKAFSLYKLLLTQKQDIANLSFTDGLLEGSAYKHVKKEMGLTLTLKNLNAGVQTTYIETSSTHYLDPDLNRRHGDAATGCVASDGSLDLHDLALIAAHRTSLFHATCANPILAAEAPIVGKQYPGGSAYSIESRCHRIRHLVNPTSTESSASRRAPTSEATSLRGAATISELMIRRSLAVGAHEELLKQLTEAATDHDAIVEHFAVAQPIASTRPAAPSESSETAARATALPAEAEQLSSAFLITLEANLNTLTPFAVEYSNKASCQLLEGLHACWPSKEILSQLHPAAIKNLPSPFTHGAFGIGFICGFLFEKSDEIAAKAQVAYKIALAQANNDIIPQLSFFDGFLEGNAFKNSFSNRNEKTSSRNKMRASVLDIAIQAQAEYNDGLANYKKTLDVEFSQAKQRAIMSSTSAQNLSNGLLQINIAPVAFLAACRTGLLRAEILKPRTGSKAECLKMLSQEWRIAHISKMIWGDGDEKTTFGCPAKESAHNHLMLQALRQEHLRNAARLKCLDALAQRKETAANTLPAADSGFHTTPQNLKAIDAWAEREDAKNVKAKKAKKNNKGSGKSSTVPQQTKQPSHKAQQSSNKKQHGTPQADDVHSAGSSNRKTSTGSSTALPSPASSPGAAPRSINEKIQDKWILLKNGVIKAQRKEAATSFRKDHQEALIKDLHNYRAGLDRAEFETIKQEDAAREENFAAQHQEYARSQERQEQERNFMQKEDTLSHGHEASMAEAARASAEATSSAPKASLAIIAQSAAANLSTSEVQTTDASPIQHNAPKNGAAGQPAGAASSPTKLKRGASTFTPREQHPRVAYQLPYAAPAVPFAPVPYVPYAPAPWAPIPSAVMHYVPAPVFIYPQTAAATYPTDTYEEGHAAGLAYREDTTFSKDQKHSFRDMLDGYIQQGRDPRNRHSINYYKGFKAGLGNIA